MDGPVKVDGIGVLRGVGIDGHAAAADADGIRRAGIPTQLGLVDMAAHWKLLLFLLWFDLDPVDVHVVADIVAPALQ